MVAAPSTGAGAVSRRAQRTLVSRTRSCHSREGQMSWQTYVQEPSLRTDIPKDALSPPLVPRPGMSYTNAATEKYSAPTFSDISDLVTRALERRRR
jgi:hypothetical protein